MILSIIFLIVSFVIEGLISNYVFSSFNNLSIFSTLYTLITLIVIYPYFYNEKKYYILLIIFGLLMDVVYTNTFMLNIFIFIIISFIVKILNFILPENILMMNIISIISVILYHILTYILLTLINYNTYPISLLLDICINSIAMTIIYTSIIYLLSKTLYTKLDKKQIK